MSLSFRFFLDAKSGKPLSGYDLGHVEIANGVSTWTSFGKKPDQGMMIFLSVVELLDGLKDFLQKENQTKFDWIGVDSSFSLIFQKNSAEDISVAAGRELIAKVQALELAAVIYRSIVAFLDDKANQLAIDDPVLEDLTVAKEEFLQVMVSLNLQCKESRAQ